MKAQGEIVTRDSEPPDDTGIPGARKTEGILHITKSSSIILLFLKKQKLCFCPKLLQLSTGDLMSNWQSVSFQ